MFKARKIYWIAQILGWGTTSLLLFLSTIGYTDVKNKRQITELEMRNFLIGLAVFFIFGVVSTHLSRFIYLKCKWLNLKFGPIIPRALVLILFSSVLLSATLHLKNYLIDINFKWVTTNFFINSFSLMLFFLLWHALYLSYHFFQQSKESEVNLIQLTASHNEIELKNLRSQLNPHFLFNSLNSIRALVEIDPATAKDSITKLSNLLRKSLIVEKQHLVSLEEEISIVHDYIDLEKVRFEERIELFTEYDARLNDLMIPPFMLQTIVENAFKHGIAQRIEGGKIWISTVKENDKAILTVKNSGNIFTSNEQGVGLQNTLRRLELQFPKRSSLKLFEKDNTVTAQISINLE